MCAHYFAYTEADLVEIQKVIEDWNKTVFKAVKLATGDVFPGNIAPIVTKDGWQPMKWGWLRKERDTLVRHVRSETATVKFQEDMAYRRCLVPATHFYEYETADDQLSMFGNLAGCGTPKSKTARKVKVLFTLPGNAAFHLAGLYSYHLLDGMIIPHFAVMTAEANISVSGIHDRMPVVLHGEESSGWLERAVLPENLPLLDKRIA